MNTRNGFPKTDRNALQTDTDISCPLKKVRDFLLHRCALGESTQKKSTQIRWNHGLSRASISLVNFWMSMESVGDIICNGHGPADMSQEVK